MSLWVTLHRELRVEQMCSKQSACNILDCVYFVLFLYRYDTFHILLSLLLNFGSVCVCVWLGSCVDAHAHTCACMNERVSENPIVYEVGVTSRGITFVLNFVNIGQIIVQITFIVM